MKRRKKDVAIQSRAKLLSPIPHLALVDLGLGDVAHVVAVHLLVLQTRLPAR